MTDLDLTKAIEAGALASKRNWYPAVTEPCDDHREDARAALTAALPIIRKQIADEVRAAAAKRYGTNQLYAAMFQNHLDGIRLALETIEKGTTK